MPERISKDKVRLTVIEFEVRSIGKYGDAQEVWHFETKQEAVEYAKKILPKQVAVIVEKHTSKYPSFLHDEPSKFIILTTFGDTDALEAGGWIPTTQRVRKESS